MTAPLNQSTARLQRYSGALRFFGWATGILGMIGGIILAATTGHHDEVNPFDPSLVTTTATHPFIALGDCVRHFRNSQRGCATRVRRATELERAEDTRRPRPTGPTDATGPADPTGAYEAVDAAGRPPVVHHKR